VQQGLYDQRNRNARCRASAALLAVSSIATTVDLGARAHCTGRCLPGAQRAVQPNNDQILRMEVCTLRRKSGKSCLTVRICPIGVPAEGVGDVFVVDRLEVGG
jgi:hypothetical protein